MTLYRSRPTVVDAVQWDGESATFEALREMFPGRVETRGHDGLQLLAGKDGAQGWVPVPFCHWIVHMPGDLTDLWPVDPDYFATKYEPDPGVET